MGDGKIKWEGRKGKVIRLVGSCMFVYVVCGWVSHSLSLTYVTNKKVIDKHPLPTVISN